MLYQLPNGLTVEMSTSDYLSLSDAELDSLMGYSNISKGINDPMYGSATRTKGTVDGEDPNYSEYYIQDVPSDEKLKDRDYDIDRDDE